MAFIDTPRFPDTISYGSDGGPQYNTTVITLASGHEQRNSNWSEPLHVYNAAYGVRSQDQVEDLIEFFHTVQGRATGFRYKDWADYSTAAFGAAITPTDQDIQLGTLGLGPYQLVKNYTKGSTTFQRDITKIVSGTVRVAIAGVEKTETTEWTLDYNTGLLTFTSGNGPTSGQMVSWGGEFDVPCRFASDQLETSLERYNMGAAQIILQEIRDIA